MTLTIGPIENGDNTRRVTPLMMYFQYDHLPQRLQAVSKPICELAKLMDQSLPDGPEKTTGLRKLLEAKDCFVRTLVDAAPKKAVTLDVCGVSKVPSGWYCNRLRGHAGPCATYQDAETTS